MRDTMLGKRMLSSLGLVGLALLIVITILAPGISKASLINDTVAASLMVDPVLSSGVDTLFDTTSVVADDPANPEFSGTGTIASATKATIWNLDILAEGFTLTAECPEGANTDVNTDPDCSDDDLLVTLTLSSLDWLPIPGILTDVIITEALEFDGPPTTFDVNVDVLSPSSVMLNFVVMDLGSVGDGISVVGEFVHAVPESSPLVLLLLGFLMMPFLRVYRA
jgi:hypothetical protein